MEALQRLNTDNKSQTEDVPGTTRTYVAQLWISVSNRVILAYA